MTCSTVFSRSSFLFWTNLLLNHLPLRCIAPSEYIWVQLLQLLPFLLVTLSHTDTFPLHHYTSYVTVQSPVRLLPMSSFSFLLPLDSHTIPSSTFYVMSSYSMDYSSYSFHDLPLSYSDILCLLTVLLSSLPFSFPICIVLQYIRLTACTVVP